METPDHDPTDLAASSEKDLRLYVPYPEGWKAHIKLGWDKHYCFSKMPGEDYFHLILHGEIYLEYGHEMYCLTCAKRQNVVSDDRLNWQKRPPRDDRQRL